MSICLLCRPSKKLFTFFFMKVDVLFVKKKSIYKPNVVYNLILFFFIFCTHA